MLQGPDFDALLAQRFGVGLFGCFRGGDHDRPGQGPAERGHRLPGSFHQHPGLHLSTLLIGQRDHGVAELVYLPRVPLTRFQQRNRLRQPTDELVGLQQLLLREHGTDPQDQRDFLRHPVPVPLRRGLRRHRPTTRSRLHDPGRLFGGVDRGQHPHPLRGQPGRGTFQVGELVQQTPQPRRVPIRSNIGQPTDNVRSPTTSVDNQTSCGQQALCGLTNPL